MKKSLLIVLSMLLVIGFAATAFAVHAEIPAETQAAVAKGTTQVTIGGQIRVRGDYRNNVADFDDDIGDNNSTYETGVWLRVNVKLTPNTEGMIEFRDTKSNGDDDSTWGSTAGDTKGRYIRGGNVSGYTDGFYTNFLQAWIQHKGSGLLGVPAAIKIGHMPMKLGYGLFYDHTKNGEDGFILSVYPTKELYIGVVTAKLYEGTTTLNNDANSYVALFTYKAPKDTNISGDITYIDDQAFSPDGLHFWNYGLRGDTKVAGLDIKADIEVQKGKAKGSTPEVKYTGWAALVGVDYILHPVKLGIEYAYGSGNKAGTTDKYEGFITLLDNIQKYSWIAEYSVPAGSGVVQTGIENTQYIKGTVGANLTSDLDGKLDLYWLRANKVDGFTYNDKDIGTELDWNIKYKIDRNLVYFIEGGYLWAGDFYKNITANAVNPDNAYAVRHGIELTF